MHWGGVAVLIAYTGLVAPAVAMVGALIGAMAGSRLYMWVSLAVLLSLQCWGAGKVMDVYFQFVEAVEELRDDYRSVGPDGQVPGVHAHLGEPE